MATKKKVSSTSGKTRSKASPTATDQEGAATRKKVGKTAKKSAAKATDAKKPTGAQKVTKDNATKNVSTIGNDSSVKSETNSTPSSAKKSTTTTEFVPYETAEGEEYMSPGQVEHFRQILLNWKRELMEEVDRTVNHMQEEAANFPDPNDRATQESEFTMELRARDRERKLIKKIDESIQLLDSGDYGYCDACGVDIGVRRLEARPTATLCIDCKTLAEIREKQTG